MIQDLNPNLTIYKSPLLQEKSENKQNELFNSKQFTMPEKSFVDKNTFIIQEKYFEDLVEL